MLPVFTGAEGWKRSRRWRRRMGERFCCPRGHLQRPRGMIDIIQDSLWGRKGGKKPVSAFFGHRERFGQSCCPVLTGGCPFGAGECPSFFRKRTRACACRGFPVAGACRVFSLAHEGGLRYNDPKVAANAAARVQNTRCCAGAQNFGEFEPCKTAVGAVFVEGRLAAASWP